MIMRGKCFRTIELKARKHNRIILIMTTTVILTSCRIQLIFFSVFLNVFLVVVQFVLGRFIQLDYLFPLSLSRLALAADNVTSSSFKKSSYFLSREQGRGTMHSHFFLLAAGFVPGFFFFLSLQRSFKQV